jgi:hypothetical protein
MSKHKMKAFKLYLKEEANSEKEKEALKAFSTVKTALLNNIKRGKIFDFAVPLEDGFIFHSASLHLPKKYDDLRIYFSNKHKTSPLIKKVPDKIDFTGAFGLLGDKPTIVLPTVEKEDDLYRLNQIIYKSSFFDQFMKYLEWIDAEPEIRD